MIMMSNIEKIYKILKENNYKLTNQREKIINVILEHEEKHLNSEEIYDLPTIILQRTIPEPGTLDVTVNVSKFLVYYCHDSILGTMLLTQFSTSHLSKAFKKISKKTQEIPEKYKNKNKRYF